MDGSGRSNKQKVDRIFFNQKLMSFKANNKIIINKIFLNHEFNYFMKKNNSLKSKLIIYLKKIYFHIF